jgi:predicted MFS family arabinose efflux permease
MKIISQRSAVLVFAAFASAYFLSTLIRAITATLSPTLTQEFMLNARDLGLLGGGYFLGFSLMQLPLGAWLDRFGPKRVIVCFLAVAVLGCLAFSLATSFWALLAARILCGVGVSACLMAPLTGYRRWFEPGTLMRANSWMLMTGSLGMVASTLPVQWLVPQFGWRPLFVGLAVLVLAAAAWIAWQAPAWQTSVAAATAGEERQQPRYADVWANPYFRRMVPIGFFCYGGMVAVQTLWASPWMTKVAGFTPLQAATGLFWINLVMLVTYWLWGLVNPWLSRRGLQAERLIAMGLPFSFLMLTILLIAHDQATTWAIGIFCLYFIACSFVSLAQPAVGMAFDPSLAGRALSAYNLVIFSGVFAVQWGIGLAVDGFRTLGLAEVQALRLAMALFLMCCIASYLHFLRAKSHNQPR